MAPYYRITNASHTHHRSLFHNRDKDTISDHTPWYHIHSHSAIVLLQMVLIIRGVVSPTWHHCHKKGTELGERGRKGERRREKEKKNNEGVEVISTERRRRREKKRSNKWRRKKAKRKMEGRRKRGRRRRRKERGRRRKRRRTRRNVDRHPLEGCRRRPLILHSPPFLLSRTRETPRDPAMT